MSFRARLTLFFALQTDLDGAAAIAERVRTAVEVIAIPRLDVAAADAALCAAKRAGENRTVRAPAPAAPARTRAGQ